MSTAPADAGRPESNSSIMRLPVGFVPAAIPGLTILLAATLAAAQTAPTPGPLPRQPQADEVPALLKSRDPRSQAWGAWSVGVGQRRALAPLVQDVVRQRLAAAADFDPTLDIALDALIQLREPLDPALWPAVYAVRPASALVAAATTADAIEALENPLRDIVRFGTGHEWFAAANLLSSRRAQAMVPDLLAPLRLKMKVFLVHSGVTMGSGDASTGGIGCGGVGLAPGMPPWAVYTLTVYANPGVTVLATGPRNVYYQRTVSPAGQTPAASIQTLSGPTGEERLKYVAAAAGIDEASLPLRGFEQHSVVVSPGVQVNAEVTRLKADLSQRFQRFLHLLVHHGALPATAVTAYRPQIDVVIEDHRGSRPR